MALPPQPPARVFAEVDPAQALAAGPNPAGRTGTATLVGREVHVTGSAEMSAHPDRAWVSLRLSSRKEVAGAARNSVSRRLEYIAHNARLRGVLEENMTVTEDFSRVENTYQMDAEVCITFNDFGQMQNVCNLLIEKLGTAVTISPPHFYHTPEAIDTLRWATTMPGARIKLALHNTTRMPAAYKCRNAQLELVGMLIFSPHNLTLNAQAMAQKLVEDDVYAAKKAKTLEKMLALLLIVLLLLLPLSRQVCVAAVGNTRRKAQEVCRLFAQSLGKPLLIKEEEIKEWGGHIDSYLSHSPECLTLQERIQNATAYASCRVFAVFEIKGKENRRNKLL